MFKKESGVFPASKKAQGLSTNTIILIILGVLVLAILILAFTGVFKDLFGKVNKSNNVDTISQACQTACTTNEVYNFCSNSRELKTEEGDYEGSCYTFALADGFSKYGIANCEALNCEETVECATWTYTEEGDEMPVMINEADMTADTTGNYCTP